MFRENQFRAFAGLPALFVLLILLALSLAGVIKGGNQHNAMLAATSAVMIVISAISLG